MSRCIRAVRHSCRDSVLPKAVTVGMFKISLGSLGRQGRVAAMLQPATSSLRPQVERLSSGTSGLQRGVRVIPRSPSAPRGMKIGYLQKYENA